MKKIALLIIFCLPLAFFSCKKDHETVDTTPPQAKVVLLNLSDSATYTVFGYGLPDTALLPPGGSKAVYTTEPIKYTFICFAKQGVVDTGYAGLTLREDTENIFILNDDNSRYAQCVGNVTTCFNPPSGKAFIRYINLSNYQKMEVHDNTNGVVAMYNSNKMLVAQTQVDTVPYGTGSLCTSVANGSYTINIYADGNANTPAHTKANVKIDADKVYYIYLDKKNEIKVIQR
jgi:hypothetical protein